MDNMKGRYERLYSRIEAAAARAGRSADEIELVAVSKQVPAEEMRLCYDLGQRCFGENRAQELRDKHPLLPDDCRWHFIGGLQANKIKYLVGKTVLIHSIYSPSQLREAERLASLRGTKADILIQINLAGERQKGGISPDKAEGFILSARQYPHINVRGLMTMPPVAAEAEHSRPLFRELRELKDSLRQSLPADERTDISLLSMGMSGDFEVAIEEGADIIRVGSALFGSRN